MSGNARAARRRELRGKTRAPAAPCPVRISEVPKNQSERDALRKECLKAAKLAGARGVQLLSAASRYYNAAVAEAGRAVREPITQPSVLTRPGVPVPTPAAPRGLEQTPTGLYVPQATR